MTELDLSRIDEMAQRLAAVEGRLSWLERALEGVGIVRVAPAPVAVRGPEIQREVAVARVAPPPVPAGYRTAGGAKPQAGGEVPRRARGWEGMEETIGRNWTSWVGAVVLVIGVFFFLKYAWDEGWLVMSPAARIWAALAGAAGFAAAGEWLYRRGMRVLAATVSGAGVAVGMAACFAAYAMFDPRVFPVQGAFAGVCVTAAAGILIALRVDAVSVAIIALLGAYLGPVVLNTGQDRSPALMGYLGALAVVAWALSYLKVRWAALRWFGLVCTALWVALWLLGPGRNVEHLPLGLTMVGFFFAGFVGEALATGQRMYRGRGEGGAELPAFEARVEESLAALTMLATAGAFGACYALLRRYAPVDGGLLAMQPVAAVAVGLACVHGVLAFATPSGALARSSALQAAALVTLAIPLALGQFAITLGWLVLAAALAGLGWRGGNRAVRVWSVVLLGLGVARLFTLDLVNRRLGVVWFEVGGQGVAPWLMMAWGTAVLAVGVGWVWGFSAGEVVGRAGQAQRLKGGGVGVAGVGTACFLVGTAIAWDGVALTVAGLAWVVGLLAIARAAGRRGDVGHAGVALLVVGLKWLVADCGEVLEDVSRVGAMNGVPVFNVAAGCGVVLVGLIAWLGRMVSEGVRRAAWVAGAVVGFAWLNVEALRAVDYSAGRFADPVTAKQVAVSVLWGVVGLGGVVVGFARRVRPLRYAALGLLGVTLGKILMVDLAQVRPVYRILSFLAVGGLLLCVSFVYHRNAEKSEARSQ